MNPDISIIVPVYNAARCLDRCVKSLAGQSLKSVEIILVNDGSSDGSGDLCDRFAAEDIRITAVHQTNAGPSSARNTGLTKAKGEYILFVDADDWMEPDAAEIMLRKARQCAADVTLGSYSIDYANNSYQIVKDMPELPDGTQDISGVIFALDLKGMFNSACYRIYRAALIHEHQIQFDPAHTNGEDFLFNCEFFKTSEKAAFVHKVVYHYMREDMPTVLTRYIPDMHIKCRHLNRARKNLYDFFEMRSPEQTRCYAENYKGYFSSCIPNLFRAGCPLTAKEKIRVMREIAADSALKEYVNMLPCRALKDRLFAFYVKGGRAGLCYRIYACLFFFKNTFDGFYRRFRKRMMLKRAEKTQ